MPEPLTSYIIAQWAQWGVFRSDAMNWRNRFTYLGQQIAANNWSAAQTECNNLANEAADWIDELYLSGGIKGKQYACLHWIDDNIGGGGGVDMDGILNALLSASFEQLQRVVGITDAYKVAIWDAPFNEEFYAALARGFKTWGA